MLNKPRARYKERVEIVKKTVKLENLKNLKIAYIPYNELLKEGLVAGLGWAIGVTIGFVVISTILVLLLKSLGGVPYIGEWVARIVESTQDQLIKRTPIIPQQF